MEKRRILIVDNNDELRVLLEQALGRLGHEVIVTGERDKALRRDDLDTFDLIISDLSEAEVNGQPIGDLQRRHLVTPLSEQFKGPAIIKAFKMGAANYLRLPYNREELREIVEQTLSHKLRYLDDPSLLSQVHEKIEFELPSDLALMNGVLEYLQERVSKLGLIRPDRSNLLVALDEAFVNAVKHGNKNDPTKLLKITAELSPKEASFTVEDEGEGFNVREIPDPWDPAKGEHGLKKHYLKWQHAALARGQKLTGEHGLQIAHHLSWGTVNAPPLLHKLPIPLAWGPLGGGEVMPWAFRKYFGGSMKKELVRVAISNRARLPDGFSLARIPNGVSGLGLVRALLPKKSASLSIEQSADDVVATVTLRPPAVQRAGA